LERIGTVEETRGKNNCEVWKRLEGRRKYIRGNNHEKFGED
jgi:hypothetical protein